jgi:putative addiction module killer protein
MNIEYLAANAATGDQENISVAAFAALFSIYSFPRFTPGAKCLRRIRGWKPHENKPITKKRLDKIKQESHFGHIRDLGDNSVELKFNDGRHIYYTIIPVNNIILLLGGNKSGQNSDINKAKNSINKAKEKAKKRGKFVS